MIIIIYQIYLMNCRFNSIEGFEGSAQNTESGIDDTNAINTLAQIAKNLMAGGATIPGAINLSNNKTKFGLINDPDNCFRIKDDRGAQVLAINDAGQIFSKGDGLVLNGNDLTLKGNTNIGGGLNVQGGLTTGGATTVPVLNLGNKFRLSGTGDAHGNDDWIRLFGVDNKGYHGGIAMNKCHIQSADLHVAGRNILAEIDALKASVVRYDDQMQIQRTNDGLYSQVDGRAGGNQGGRCNTWTRLRIKRIDHGWDTGGSGNC